MGMRGYSFDVLNFALIDMGRPPMEYRKRAEPSERSMLAGLAVLELGCQVVRETNDVPAKTFFTEYGAEHFSIDLNGSYESLPINLATEQTCSEIEAATGRATFELITNYGTTEHIVPLMGQYQTFKNVHNLCRSGGYMIHECPMAGFWAGHSPAHYQYDFFQKLAEVCGYDVICYTKNGPMANKRNVACVLRKNEKNFCSPDDFPIDGIQWKEGKGYQGMYYDANPNSRK